MECWRYTSEDPRSTGDYTCRNLLDDSSVRTVMRVSRRLLPVVVAVCAVHAPLIGQTVHPVPSPEVRAVPLGNQLIKLDGKLDEEIWHTAPVASDLRQSRPHEGQPATQRTEVRFAFDDAYLYVGAR